MTSANGSSQALEELLPPAQQASLFEQVRVLDGIDCHLMTAGVKDTWAVLSDEELSLQTFAL